jgi:hypothetical protein
MVKKCLVSLCLLFFAAAVYADIAPAEIKADYGANFRLRQEYWENVMSFDVLTKTDRDFFRLRSSLWGQVDFTKDTGIYARLTNEARYYLGSYRPFITADASSDDDRFDEDELVIDNLHFTARNIFGLPVDLRIGRQDFLGMYGEGLVIIDGTPGDGSRTAYFDAIKATWRINDNHSVDVIYLNNRQRDEFLPTLNPARSDSLPTYVDNERLLNVSDERGFIVYGRNRLNKNLLLEPYYIYKEEDSVGSHFNPKFGGPRTALDLNTVGARIVFTVSNWTVRGEYAHEFGEYDDDRDRKAGGGYLFVGQKFPEITLKPEWELGYIYLSGDDPSTKDHEGWDPLFSRSPSWNEVFTYPLVYETTADSGPIPCYWTNLHLIKLGLKLALAPATNLALSYQYLRADEETKITTGSAAALFTNNSKDRGHIGTFMLTHTFTKQIDGFLQVEYFAPGDFYSSKADDSIFLRWQLQFKF